MGLPTQTIASVTVRSLSPPASLFRIIEVGPANGPGARATAVTWRQLADALAAVAWRDETPAVLLVVNIVDAELVGLDRVAEEAYLLRSRSRPVFAWAQAAGGASVALLGVCDLVLATPTAQIGPLGGTAPSPESRRTLADLRETARMSARLPNRYGRQPFEDSAIDRMSVAGVVAEQLESRGVDLLAGSLERALAGIIRRTSSCRDPT